MTVYREMTMRAIGVSITAALMVLSISCGSAAAASGSGLEPGVHVDPGSPAAKEYALPLNQARATGGVSSSRSHSREGALFGAGIKPPGSGASGSGSGGSGSPRSSGSAGSRGAAAGRRESGAAAAALANGPGAGSAALPAAVVRATREQEHSEGAGSALALLGGAIAIIVLGGFGGTVLRHSRRPTPSA